MRIDRIHVVPQDDLWLVVKVGELFRGPYQTKDDAIEVARFLARLSDPAQLLIHDVAGDVEAVTVVGS